MTEQMRMEIMSECEKQARDFLKDCRATIKMMYLGREKNENWDDGRERDVYMVNIATPRGNMQVKFWDGVVNTRKNMFSSAERRAWRKPTAYDILSCLTTYDVGDIEDFISEFGYEIKKRGDLTRIQNTYNAVKKEYEDVCLCFTEKQIERLSEIL